MVVTTFSPTILVDIYISPVYFANTKSAFWKSRSGEVYWGVSIYKRFATRDFYDDNGNFYKGTLLDAPKISKELSDLFYGVEQSASITLEFSNIDNGIDDTWDDIVNAEEIRGKGVKIQRHDPTDGTSFEFRGKIVDYTIGPTVSFTIEMRDDEILDTLLPKAVVTTDTFTETALDLGMPINICIGHCRNVPLRNIQNDITNNYFDYLIGYGPIEDLWVDHANGIGVKRDGVLVNPSEYTFYDGSQASPFPGYAFLRFIVEQVNFSGGHYHLTADVKGLKMGGLIAERNFANVIKNVLSDSTWGLNDSVGATSFSNAATDIDNIGNMYCDGAITEQRQARDIIDDLLFPARAFIERGSDGEWEITIDKPTSSVTNLGDNDGYYNNCEVLSVSATPAKEALKFAKVQYALDMDDEDHPFFEMELSIYGTFGIEKTYQLPFVREHATAEKVLSYLKFRSIYSDKRVSLKVGMEGRNLSRSNVITLDAPARNISAKKYMIERISKSLTDFVIDCREYSTSIYNTTSITYPTSQSGSTTIVYGPQSDISLWVTKSTNFTAYPNGRYRIDTSTGVVEMTLPTSAQNADKIYWVDYALNFGTNEFIIRRSSHRIYGFDDDLTCNNDGENGILEYTGSTFGWIIL
jgi:hypothetical protein